MNFNSVTIQYLIVMTVAAAMCLFLLVSVRCAQCLQTQLRLCEKSSKITSETETYCLYISQRNQTFISLLDLESKCQKKELDVFSPSQE